MCLSKARSLSALSSSLSKCMLTLSRLASRSSLISCYNDVSLTLLLCVSWRCSQMFCSSIIACWSSSYLLLYSRYFMFHLALSKSMDKASISNCYSWMISLSSAFVGYLSVSSSWRRTNSVSRSPDGLSEGPSSCTGSLPLSYSCVVDVRSEAPSTLGGDNTRFAAVNKCLLPLW